jgi:hypothetical protein
VATPRDEYGPAGAVAFYATVAAGKYAIVDLESVELALAEAGLDAEIQDQDGEEFSIVPTEGSLRRIIGSDTNPAVFEFDAPLAEGGGRRWTVTVWF